MRALLLALLLPLQAAACPAQAPIAERTDALHERLAAAPDPATAQRLSGALWAIWTRAPDETAQELLDAGMTAIRVGDLARAADVLTRLTAYCPDYAEGWNQRAFARYLSGDYAGAVADLDVAIGLSPRHLGALTGQGLSYLAMGQRPAGEAVIRRALRLNPWLGERGLLENPDAVDL